MRRRAPPLLLAGLLIVSAQTNALKGVLLFIMGDYRPRGIGQVQSSFSDLHAWMIHSAAPSSASETPMSDSPITRERRVTVRALLVGDRIETAGLERNDVLSTVPLAFRAGQNGVVALFRYGVVVSVGMSPLEEEEVIGRLK